MSESRETFVGQSLNFLSQSRGNPTDLKWTFGDSTPTASGANVRHAWTTPGTYTVTFADGQKVTVDGDLYVTVDGKPAYGRFDSSQGMWFAILEKAYAQLKGSYDTIGDGGIPGDVMTSLTGKPAGYWNTKDAASNALFDKIKQGGTGHRPMTAITWGEKDNVNYTGTGVHAWHTYSVLGAVEENGVKYVQLRNPWGESEPVPGDGKNDGIFFLKLDDFMKLYETVMTVR